MARPRQVRGEDKIRREKPGKNKGVNPNKVTLIRGLSSGAKSERKKGEIREKIRLTQRFLCKIPY